MTPEQLEALRKRLEAALINGDAESRLFALRFVRTITSGKWQIVPVEPDSEMADRGLFTNQSSTGELHSARPAWAAMLAAAPNPLESSNG